MKMRPSVLLKWLVAACLTGPLAAEQKYNPYTGKWETVRPRSELKYNPNSGNWNYTAPDAQPNYNPYNGNWDMARPSESPPLL